MVHRKYYAVGAIVACLAMPAAAMQALDDLALSGVAGQDGISIAVDAPQQGITANAVQWKPDASTLSLNDVAITGVGADGAMAGADAASATLTIDVGADAGTPLLALDFSTNTRLRLRTDSLTIPSAFNKRSLGTWAFDFEGGVQLINSGIFNAGYGKAYMLGEIKGADLFYRQGDDTRPWMLMHDLNLKWNIPSGVLGIENDGVVHRTGTPGSPGALKESDLIRLAMDFEMVTGSKVGSEEFRVTSDARGLMFFGWLGAIRDVELKWSSGGVWQGATDGKFDPYGANAVTTEGLRFSSQWDYINLDDIAANSFLTADDEFRWRLGETADVASANKSRINFELGDWVMWGTRTARKPSPHYFPLIALDVIDGAGQGPGGLCWGHGPNYVDNAGSCGTGGQFVNVQPGRIGDYYGFSHTGDSGGLAVLVRDGQLQAYSRKLRLLERNAAGVQRTDIDPNRPGQVGREFNWGLIYSLANVDANIYLYPGGSGHDNNYGVIADLLVVSQTLDAANEVQARNWDHGTHLMIADTDANMGIGFISSSFVVAGNDTRVWVKPRVGGDYYSGGLDFFSPEARFNYRATFGGGLLPGHAGYGVSSRAQTVLGADIDLNLEGLVNMRFSPSDPNEANNPGGARNYLGFSGALRLGSNFGDGMLGATTNLANCGSDGQSACGSYLSLAEPSQPDAAFRLANITGDIAFTEGRVDIVGTGEITNNPEPKMVIANNIKLGYAAGPRLGEVLDSVPGIPNDAGQPVLIDSIMLGTANLGRIIIPSAQMYSSITLEPQSAAVPFIP